MPSGNQILQQHETLCGAEGLTEAEVDGHPHRLAIRIAPRCNLVLMESNFLRPSCLHDKWVLMG